MYWDIITSASEWKFYIKESKWHYTSSNQRRYFTIERKGNVYIIAYIFLLQKSWIFYYFLKSYLAERDTGKIAPDRRQLSSNGWRAQ